MMKPQVLIFMTGGHIESVPSLRALVRFLADNGHKVTLICPADGRHRQLSIAGPNVTQYAIPLRPGRGKFGRVQALFGWYRDATRLQIPSGAICIGVDAEGLLMAHRAAIRSRARLVYCSLEILCLSDHDTWGNRLVKAIERRCHRKAELTIIQDSQRAALLGGENRLANIPCVYLPNSSGEAASNAKTDYLQRRLALTAKTKIALHAGTIANWSDSIRLAAAAAKWPPEWVLVFQCRCKPEGDYASRVLTMADNRRIWVLANPLETPEFHQLVASADVGVALYSPVVGHHISGKNVAVMGKSSGKIATYLQHGLPVVATQHSSLEYIDRYNAGRMVMGADEVVRILPELSKDALGFSRRAVTCYENEFDLSSGFNSILAAFSPMAPQSQSI